MGISAFFRNLCGGKLPQDESLLTYHPKVVDLQKLQTEECKMLHLKHQAEITLLQANHAQQLHDCRNKALEAALDAESASVAAQFCDAEALKLHDKLPLQPKPPPR